MSYVVLLVIFVVVGRFVWNEWNGSNYYRQYPVAREIERIIGEEGPDEQKITDSIVGIDLKKPKSTHADQFVENLKK